jgi:dihydrofolate synthase / folylpolyglutamate synthase
MDFFSENEYQQTIQWMFNQLPMYQSIGAAAYKKDLTNTQKLANYLGNPEANLTCIHVAGTNGKGSTSHLLASILQEAGYKVGLYTSPHLKDFRERIKINGIEIEKKFIVQFIASHKPFFEENQLSFFEMTVGLAFQYFKTKKTDINIIEVGMGGRLDSTNIITPIISVITNIGLDHTQFLGDTLALIAAEKAGIIKPKIPVVVGEFTPQTKPVFEAVAKKNNSEIFYASNNINTIYPTVLLGNYQQANCKTVLQTIEVLNDQKHFFVSNQNLKNGFLNVIKNTKLLGRWQQIGENPKIICDTGHNAHGLEIVMQQLQTEIHDNLHIVLGVVNDKKLDDILPLFPKKAIYYFCKPNIPRGLDVFELKAICETYGLFGSAHHSVLEALIFAKKNADPFDLIFVGGSTFVVAEVV